MEFDTMTFYLFLDSLYLMLTLMFLVNEELCLCDIYEDFC